MMSISLSAKAYRERYLAWRTGDAQGAKYDLTTAASRLPHNGLRTLVVQHICRAYMGIWA